MYGLGASTVDAAKLGSEFYAEHGEHTGMSEDTFGNLLNRANLRYADLPYHGFIHPIHVMYDAAALIDRYKVKIPEVGKIALFSAIAYHDAGNSYPAEQRVNSANASHLSAEEFSAHLLSQDSVVLGLDEEILSEAQKCINATKPGHFKLKTILPRLIVRADIANVVSDDSASSAESTKRALDEEMIITHQDKDDFVLESFIRSASEVLVSFLKRDLHLGPNDKDWPKQSARAQQWVATTMPYVARNHFEELMQRLHRNFADGVYPYMIPGEPGSNQESSSLVSPVPILDWPDPSTTS